MSDDMNDLKQFRDFEDGVRRGLAEKADGIRPRERLDAILAAGAPKRRTPLWIVGAAAAVVLVAALGIGYLLQNQGTAASTAAGAAPAERDNASNKQLDTSGAPSAGTPSVPTTTTIWAMPVYSVVTGTSTQPWLLTRTFVSVPDISDRTNRVDAAVSAALSGSAPDGQSVAPYNLQRPWRAGTTATVTVTDTQITIKLNQPGALGLVAQMQKIAVQSLVWTATAAAQLTVPVRVQLASGGGVFATMPAGTYSRPAVAESYTDLVPIWIDSPAAGSTVSSPVTVSGQACVFEAQFSWEVLRGTSVVANGNAMASSGCPARGDYSFTTGTLAPGQYTIRVWEVSMKDGSVQYETRVPITVA
jgi:hypothetical protein